MAILQACRAALNKKSLLRGWIFGLIIISVTTMGIFMNTTRFALAVIAAFIFVSVLEWFVHGRLLMEAYSATQQLWRPMVEGDMTYFKFLLISQFAQAFMITYIFTRHYESKGLGEGLRFGLYIGLLLVALDLAKYAYMPVDFSLIAAWMGASLVKGLGTGAVLSFVYKR
jgi:hypothetical protein